LLLAACCLLLPTTTTMLLLEIHNRIVMEAVRARVENADRPEAVDITCADFDGVTFHVSTDANDKNALLVSVSTRCFMELEKYGVKERLKKVYGPLYQAEAEASYDATLKIDVTKAPKEAGFYRKVAMLKRHVLATPFYHVAEAIDKKQKTPLIEIRYRSDESLYLHCEGTGIVAIFGVCFKDADDVLFAKVFLSEFADARKTIRGAPSVKYSHKEPPHELQSVSGVESGDNRGFVSVALFPEHLHAQKRDRTISQMLMFRNQLMFNIKVAKAHLHDRMRKRVVSLLQVLNRAKQPKVEGDVKKKTMSGKTFSRS